MDGDTDGNPALSDPRLDGVDHDVVTHGPVSSLEEAALARGVTPAAIVKTMVVRLSDDEYVFVLVPGDRVIDWGKLRSELGVNRISLPDEAAAKGVTGYARGTITPFGSTADLRVYADSRLASGRISIGGGAKGVSISIDGNVALEILDAVVADVTKPAQPIEPGGRGEERR